MLSKKKEHEIKKLLHKGKTILNKLNLSFDDKRLQNLLYNYNKCKDNPIKMKKAVKALNGIGSYINHSDLERMKIISEASQ